jgi:hypothetical protein
MKTSFRVAEISVLPNGNVLAAGAFEGKPLTAKQCGVASAAPDRITVEVIPIGIVDPNQIKPGMQAVQLRMLTGRPEDLKGCDLEFSQ